MSGALTDLRALIALLRREGELVEIDAPVDPHLELAEVHRRVIAAGGPALLFRNPTTGDFPVITNLFGTRRRVALAFGDRPRTLVEELARLPVELMPPSLGKLWGKRALFKNLARIGTKTRSRGAVSDRMEAPPRLSRLPALTCWKEDGGPFITLPLVHTQSPVDGVDNLGMYRLQVFDDEHTGMHFQIGKGGGFHLAEAEARGEDLPVHVSLGGPPALTLAAIAPLPEGVPEFLLASLVMGRKLGLAKDSRAPLPLVADAEFVLSGRVLRGARRPEGPFGDHYGYYSLQHDYPVFRCERLFEREGAIYPATVVGKPRQEDFFIGDYLQELLSPLFPVVMPAVKDLWSYGETGYHSLAGAVVRERYPREAMVQAFRILGEGQLSLTKFLLATDGDVDLRDFPATLRHVLARFDPARDLYVFPHLSMDTLDYTGPEVNRGSKGVLLGLGDPVRDLPGEFAGEVPSAIDRAAVFTPGCLVLSGASHAEEPDLADALAADPVFESWPLVVLVDDASRAAASSINFLWTTFTRFEPEADIHGRAALRGPNQIGYRLPIVIDARMKGTYPDELITDDATKDLVTRRWAEYFPGGQDMGDSDAAHLD